MNVDKVLLYKAVKYHYAVLREIAGDHAANIASQWETLHDPESPNWFKEEYRAHILDIYYKHRMGIV
jgi:hypothetical protein